MQTRLPPELAMELESITAEYQETLVLLAESGSDVGENDPMRGPLTFPAQALLTAMDSAVTVGLDIAFRWQMPRWRAMTWVPRLFRLPQHVGDIMLF